MCIVYSIRSDFGKNLISEYRSTGLDMEFFGSRFRRPDQVQGIFREVLLLLTNQWQFLNNLNSTPTSLLYHLHQSNEDELVCGRIWAHILADDHISYQFHSKVRIPYSLNRVCVPEHVKNSMKLPWVDCFVPVAHLTKMSQSHVKCTTSVHNMYDVPVCGLWINKRRNKWTSLKFDDMLCRCSHRLNVILW